MNKNEMVKAIEKNKLNMLYAETVPFFSHMSTVLNNAVCMSEKDYQEMMGSLVEVMYISN